MNWRKGLLRAWIVTATTWIVLVLVVANPVQQLFGPQPPATFHDGEQAIEFPAGTSRAVVEKALTGYVNESRAKSPYAGIGTPVETVGQEVGRLIGNYRPVSKWAMLGSFAALALLPPFALLGIGWAVAWVMRGFQR